LGSTGVVNRAASHLPARLNAEISQVAKFLAVSAKHSRFPLILSSEGRRRLGSLLGAAANEVVLLEKTADD